MRQHIKDLTHALLATTLSCIIIGSAALVVQEIEGSAVTRSLFKFLRRRSPHVTVETYFDRAIQPALIDLLHSLERGDIVRMAAFAFTDPVVAEILTKKYLEDKVDIEIIADVSGLQHTASQIPRLAKTVPVYCYPSPHIKAENRPPLQHNKFLVIMRKEGTVVATGSYNFTHSAAQSNCENCIMVYNDLQCAQEYCAYFNELRSLSVFTHDLLSKPKEKLLKRLDPIMEAIIKGAAV